MATNPSSSETSQAILKQGDILRLEISPQFANIKVQPNGNEGLDANFPKNLHNAAELFLKCGLVPNAVKLKECVDSLLERYASNSDQQNVSLAGLRLGQACVCWECGHCGMPKNGGVSSSSSSSSNAQLPPGPCANCNGTNQVNWVIVTRGGANAGCGDNMETLPWIEETALTEEHASELKAKKEKELAERRAVVEARVAEALAERERQQQMQQN